MKNYTFTDYCRLMEGVGPKTRERILDVAAKDENLNLEAFVELCELAFPEPA